MKKILMLAPVLALALLLCAFPAYADVASDVEAGQGMDHDTLVQKAMAESGAFVVY